MLSIAELHNKAQDIAFKYYLRRGKVPQVLLDIIAATKSYDDFCRWKFNPNHDELGRFTFGADDLADETSNVTKPQPPKGKDPGAVYAQYANGEQIQYRGETITDLNGNELVQKSSRLLMPKGVTISHNVTVGEAMSIL